MTLTNFTLVPAPVAVLALLGAAAATLSLLAATAVSALAGRAGLARRLGFAAAAIPTLYALLLLVLGAATPTRVVPRGAEKFFCEIDCHVGYAVTGVRETAERSGTRVVVTLRSRFDETTISPRRGNAPLTPNPRAVSLVDAGGRRFSAEPAGVAALLASLRPGESYATDLVFHVPDGARGLRLSLVESEGPLRLLLGHERALLAGETLLALN
jgi:hypothetical protein